MKNYNLAAKRYLLKASSSEASAIKIPRAKRQSCLAQKYYRNTLHQEADRLTNGYLLFALENFNKIPFYCVLYWLTSFLA